MVLITLLSLFSFPADEEQKIWVPHLDKLVHAGFHCGIVVLGSLFLKKIGASFKSTNTIFIRIFIFSVLYGILIELLQHIMPYDRAAEIWDILANLTGALLGVLLIKKYFSLNEKLK